MDSSHAASPPGGEFTKKRKIKSSGGGDCLSKLNDRALGHVLSFLPAEEAARAALLSSRWRHVFAAVHTVSLEEPESPIPERLDDGYDSPGYSPPPDPNAPLSFYSTVSAAIIARQRRRGAVPLRALRVAVEGYLGGESSTVDQWVSYAVQQAAAAAEGLDLDLRLCCRVHVCDRPYALRRRGQQQHERPTGPVSHSQYGRDSDDDDGTAAPSSTSHGDSTVPPSHSDDDGIAPSSDSDDDQRKKLANRRRRWVQPVPVYTATRVIFSCAHLRSLSLGSCRLAPPDAINLPSLVTLLLSHVSDPGSDVARLVAGCPRLADLTLEACRKVTTLTVVGGGARLRRLALRCCHNLTAVAVDSSELQAFVYRGAVPGSSFLAMHGGSTRIAYCKVDICGEETTSEEELANLWQLLQLFVNAEHLHLESARLGSGLDRGVPIALPCFPSLLHLEMRGRLPGGEDDDTGAAIAAVSTVLEHAPNLETLSLAFRPLEHGFAARTGYDNFSMEELHGAHHLSYNPHSVLATPTAMIIPCCLRDKVREINLVHYQGGTAQRALAKFLLSNAPVVDRLWCEFAEGPMWTQTQLMREIEGWLINKSAETHFA